MAKVKILKLRFGTGTSRSGRRLVLDRHFEPERWEIIQALETNQLTGTFKTGIYKDCKYEIRFEDSLQRDIELTVYYTDPDYGLKIRRFYYYVIWEKEE